MSSDLKIEIFAYYCFHKIWLFNGIKKTGLNIVEIYGDEFEKNSSYSDVCDDLFVVGIKSRTILFSNLYFEELNFEKSIKWSSLSDFYDYVTRVCDRDDWFGHLTIFERMFATVAFVLYLCTNIYQYAKIDVFNYGYIIWAMYFDKFTAKFYEEGGWNELRREAKRHISITNSLDVLKNEILIKSFRNRLKEASINYYQFQKAVKYKSRKYSHKSINHISKLWIKFHIQYIEEYVRIPLSYEESADCVELELLLQYLKFICNFSFYVGEGFVELQDQLQRIFDYTRMLFSKTFAYCGEIETRNDLRIENLKTTETFYKEFPDSGKFFEKQLQNECSTQSEKIVTYEIIDQTERENSSAMGNLGSKSGGNLDRHSLDSCNILHDGIMNSRFDTNMENYSKISDLDLNYEITNICSDSKSGKGSNCISPRHEKLQCELLNEENSSSQKDNNEWHRKSPPKELPNPMDFCSKKEVTNSYNEGESSISSLKSLFDTKIKEGCYRNTEITCSLTTNESTVLQCEGNAFLNKMSFSNDSCAVNDFMMNNAGRIDTHKELDKLREEQADPEILNFLRMFLILGDRQGIQYVRGTLCNSKECGEKSQVRSNKKKKRCNKKSIK